MDVSNKGDPQIDINGHVDIFNTYWRCTPNTSLAPPGFRLHTFPLGDNLTTVATPDHSLALSRGYMAGPTDFRNVEFTCYLKIEDYLSGVNLDEDYVSVYFRGGVKTTANHGCSGTGYRSGIEYDGGWHCTKYYQYPNNYYINPKSAFRFSAPRPTTNLKGKWIGMKVLCYDVPPIGQTSYHPDEADVKIECYYDYIGSGSEPPIATNDWKKYFEIYDRGKGSPMGHTGNVKDCKAKNMYEKLLWGGPIITLRIDNVESVLIKWLSVREIDTLQLPDGGTNPPVISPEALVYNLYPDPSNELDVTWTRLGLVWNDNYASIDRCWGGPDAGPVSGQGPDLPKCATGYHYDLTTKTCVKDTDVPPDTGGGGGTPPGTGKVYDAFGVQMIYPTSPNPGVAWYLDMNNPYSDGKFNISYGTGSQYPYTTHTDPNGFKYFNTRGEVVTYASGGPSGRSQRLDIYPDGGKWNNKTSYSWQNNPGYLYTDKGIRCSELTSFIRGRNDLGSNVHHSWAHKINGRDEDAIRSEIEGVRTTVTHSDLQFNYNYAHSPYVNRPVTKVSANWPPIAQTDHWYGFKTVHLVSADRKTSKLEMWCDDDPFDSTTGKPKNNWYLAGTINDTGCSEYNNIICTWKCHKDTIRIDGWDSCDFTYLSDREIDPTAIPGQWDADAGTGGGGNPPPPPPAGTRPPTGAAIWAIINGQASTTETDARQYGMLITHELVESLTDADYNTKEGFGTSGGDEIGDVCTGNTSSTYGSGADSLYVEGYYSNSDGGCVVPGLITKTGGSNSTIIDGGGPLLQNAVVYLLYWGATWQSDSALAGLKTMIDHKVKDLLLNTDKQYFSKLSQYGGINTPVWGGSVVDNTTTLPPNGIADSATVSFIKGCISQGLVPSPSSMNWQTWYCVILKPGRYQSGFSNLDNAYHDSFALTTTTTGPLTDRTFLTYNNGTYTSQYHLYAGGLDWTKKVGLLIYADGSEEYGLNNVSDTYLLAGTNGMINVAKRNNMILLTPFAPNKNCADGGSCWYFGPGQTQTNCPGYAKWAEDLVNYVYSQYPTINKTRVAFGGYSSGAQLATEWWIPSGAAQRTMDDGVVVAISFGGAPKMTEVTYTSGFKANVPLVWNYGSNDPSYLNNDGNDLEGNLFPNTGVQAGYNYYTSAGFGTHIVSVSGLGHDRSDFGSVMDTNISLYVPSA